MVKKTSITTQKKKNNNIFKYCGEEKSYVAQKKNTPVSQFNSLVQ